MNNKGFTLIELILVITLLGIIALIAVPAITGILNDSKKEASKDQEKIIINAAKTYMVNNSTKLPTDKCYVSVAMLKNEGLLSSEEITDPGNKNNKFDGYIVITFENNKYKYNYLSDNDGINKCGEE